MAKFKDTEVLTNQVYLNIKQGENVETATMSTTSALRKYGEKEVVYISDPRYSEENITHEPDKGNKGRKTSTNTRKAGITDVILE